MASPRSQALSSPFLPNVLEGKVALVTGGGTGIGFQIAKDFGLHGAKIVLFSRRREVLDKAVQELSEVGVRAIACSGDVRSQADAAQCVDTAVKAFGRLDIVVNNAAGNFLAPVEQLAPKGFKTVLDIDAVGTYTISHTAIPELKKTKGSILNISATFHYSAMPNQAHAAAAKAAVDATTRSMAVELGQYGIRVNGLAPGPIADTVGFQKLSGGHDIDELVKVAVPLQRLGVKLDISRAALFLMTSAGSFITGHVLVVDGGSWMSKIQVVAGAPNRSKF